MQQFFCVKVIIIQGGSGFKAKLLLYVSSKTFGSMYIIFQFIFCVESVIELSALSSCLQPMITRLDIDWRDKINFVIFRNWLCLR